MHLSAGASPVGRSLWCSVRGAQQRCCSSDDRLERHLTTLKIPQLFLLKIFWLVSLTITSGSLGTASSVPFFWGPFLLPTPSTWQALALIPTVQSDWIRADTRSHPSSYVDCRLYRPTYEEVAGGMEGLLAMAQSRFGCV